MPYEGFSIRHNALFKRNGKLLCEVENKSEETVAKIKDSNEIWLLEDMSLAVVRCIEMTDNDDEHMAYRFVIGHKMSDFDTDGDVFGVLEDIEYMVDGNTDMYEE